MNRDGSEFLEGCLSNGTLAQPLDVFDQILQEVERTNIKASDTLLRISRGAYEHLRPDQRVILHAHFAVKLFSKFEGEQSFILMPR